MKSSAETSHKGNNSNLTFLGYPPKFTYFKILELQGFKPAALSITMRLLKTAPSPSPLPETEEFIGSQIPPYAILSRTLSPPLHPNNQPLTPFRQTPGPTPK